MSKISAMEALTRLYAQADPVAQAAAKTRGATCRAGCTACCGLLASITVADGLYLAEGVLSRPNWEEWLPKLVEFSKNYCYEGITKENWFSKKILCVFLKDNLCQVYDRRPAACRYHYVISPPGDCSPDVPPTTRTLQLDMIDLEAKTSWAVAEKMTDFPITAPIPILTLHSMFILTAEEKWKDRREKIEAAADQVPNPLQWMKTYAYELFTMSQQELAALLEARQG